MECKYKKLGFKKIESLCKYDYAQSGSNVDDVKLGLEVWENKGRPHCWGIVDQFKNYSVAVDTGWGHVALFKYDEVVSYGASGSTVLIFESVVAIDPNYYGIGSGNWIHINPRKKI